MKKYRLWMKWGLLSILLVTVSCRVNINGKFYPEETESLHFRIIDREAIPENIANLENLKELTYTFGKITAIENLEYSSNLTYLDLSYNNISNIGGLESLLLLTELNLAGNHIQTIENLDHLTELERLNLADNELKRVENIEGLQNLKILNIMGNSIRKISSSSYQLLLNNKTKIVAFDNGKTNTIKEYISNYSVTID